MPRTSVWAVSLLVTAIVLAQVVQLESGCSSTSSCAKEPTKTSVYVLDDEPEVPAPLEPAGRVREQQLDEGAQREAVHEHADREDPVVVRLGEAAEEPEVRDEDEEEARPVVRTPPERDHAGDEEREPDGEGEREERGLVLQMVARKDEPRADRAERQATGGDEDE